MPTLETLNLAVDNRRWLKDPRITAISAGLRDIEEQLVAENVRHEQCRQDLKRFQRNLLDALNCIQQGRSIDDEGLQ